MSIKVSIFTVMALVFLLSAAGWSLVVVDENFDNYDIFSQLVGQGGWAQGSGWGTNLIRIVDACTDPGGCAEPQRAARWQSPPGAGGSTFSSTNKAFPVVWTEGIAQLYISIMFDATAKAGIGGNTSYIQIFDGNGVEATRIYMAREDGLKGRLSLLGKSGSTSGNLWQPVIVQDPVNGQWYHIKMEVDVTNRKYDVYVGDGDRFGGNEGHWDKVVENLYFYFPATGLGSVNWQMFDRADDYEGPAYFSIDNLYIFGPDSGEAKRSTEIWVANGVCQEQVTLAPYVNLYGGFAGNERTRDDRNGLNPTIIDPGDSSKSVITSAAMSSVDGFIIRGGNNGVDASASPPVLTNNIITANVGAGVACGSGSATIQNNTIISNAVGILTTNANPNIANNIIASNSTGISGSGGSPELSNNNLFNNAVDYDGISPGSGDIAKDPMFIDGPSGDYRLTFGSPCIDAGNPAVHLATDFQGGSRPVDGSGDGFDVIDIGAFESQFTPDLRFMRYVKREGDHNVLRIDRAIVTAAWPDYVYVESDDRLCGIRVEKPGHGLIAGMRVNAAGRLKTDDNGERYIEAVTTTPDGEGSVEPLGLTNVPLGGTDYSYDSLTGAGQMGAKAWRWVWKPELERSVREFDYAHGPNNIGLLVKVWGRVTWSQGNEFYVDDGSRFDDFETPDETAPSGVKAVLPTGTAAPSEGAYVQVTGISSCYKSGQQVYRLLRVPAGGLYGPSIVTIDE